jgi:RNA polymerase sigma-B factor
MAPTRDLAGSDHLTAEIVAASRRPPRSGQASDKSATKRFERLLFRRYQRHGDLHARRELIDRYLPLAHSLARRYDGRGDSAEDLAQVASLGLVKAIDRFDPERGLSFSSYAVPTMLGELRRYFRDSGWALHVPREMQERVLKVRAAVERLYGELGRSPSPQQIAHDLNLPVEDVLEAIAANVAYETGSLDTPLRSGDGDADGQTVAEAIGETDERFELVERCAAIGPALKTLPERDRLILHLRFMEDLTQSEIAQRIGVSQMHVSRLLRRALEHLRLAAA